MTATPPLPLPAAPRRSGVPLVQGTLALDFPLPSGLPAVPQAPALTLVRDGSGARAHATRAHPHPSSGQQVPPAGPPGEWAGRFVQAVVEVISGDRPLQQLIRWTDDRVYADLRRRVRILGLTTSAESRTRIERSHVRSVRVFQPHPDAAEIAAHVRHGARSRAVAARVDVIRGRWMCTALHVG
ncbi:MAG: Rv3235 family protein [Nocardioidaceae bacterium]